MDLALFSQADLEHQHSRASCSQSLALVSREEVSLRVVSSRQHVSFTSGSDHEQTSSYQAINKQSTHIETGVGLRLRCRRAAGLRVLRVVTRPLHKTQIQ